MIRRIKKFFTDLFRANEQVPIIVASILMVLSFDIIKWATSGEGATYEIPVAQAILIGVLVVLSGVVFARWVIKWQWKSLDEPLKNGFDPKDFIPGGPVSLGLLFTCFLIWAFVYTVAALLS